MAYIALKRMKVGTEYRDHGDPMPEAADWPWQTRETYLRGGYLEKVPDPPAPAPPAADTEPAGGPPLRRGRGNA